ncbi:MAG: protein-glutamate O-methyltransferase CheR [Alphaproteobacteria bacterium]|nr:protein-glutamate O-methyltransferase CheR [Alphaproteobacteria bacterium]MBV9419653.1 protein-glutamate O-methyltransferase CheR [Alphaproteobacteria bacterium]MBV9541385.1 protein-glutamate O-methyltransferase CheR [Alphaproteobacteria bacterium]MBV9905904.1 protein-glutamate O-methyltransferase CheR [Alphaproteobacteria bacterium]
MTADDLSFLAQVVRRRSGLVLPASKAHLIEGRLSTVMRRFGFKTVDAVIKELRHGGRDTLARAVTEAMTTNESSFFRDRAAFEQFRDLVLPQLMESRAESKRLRIWSAACAAGQEAYSIAMLLDDRKLLAQGWTIDLVATDLSAEMIARAEEGIYSHFEVQRGLAIRRLVAHFTQEGGNWRINENLRRMVMFRQFNLLDSYGWLDDLDVVFCRNVLMYFDKKTKVSVLDKIAEILLPDGVLLLGHAETVTGLSDTFVPISRAPSVYVKGKAQAQRLAG